MRLVLGMIEAGVDTYAGQILTVLEVNSADPPLIPKAAGTVMLQILGYARA